MFELLKMLLTKSISDEKTVQEIQNTLLYSYFWARGGHPIAPQHAIKMSRLNRTHTTNPTLIGHEE